MLFIAAVALRPIISEANYIVEQLRYTSLCTRCGQQNTEVFYLVLGTEMAHQEAVLPLSAMTSVAPIEQRNCRHGTVLIGKTSFGLSKELNLDRAVAGAPAGWDFRGMDLRRTFLELEGMRTGAVLGHMNALVKARERGDRVSATLLSASM